MGSSTNRFSKGVVPLRFILILGITLLGGTWAFPAASALRKVEIAKNLYRAGKGFFKDKQYLEALKSFSKAYSLSGRHILLYNIALCQGRLGRAKEAKKTFTQYLVHFPKERADVAKRLKKLDELIANTFLVVTGGVHGAKVYVNGTFRGTLPLSGRLSVPSEEPLQVVVLVDKSMRYEKSVRVMAGETTTVSATLVTTQAKKVPKLVILTRKKTQVEKKRTRASLLPRLLWGAGAVFLIGGSASGIYALNRVAKAEEANSDGQWDLQRSYEDQAKRYGWITDGAFALSVSALAAGTLLYYLENK